MTAQDEARYRLGVAAQRLARAEQDERARRWVEAALFARMAIENAAKAIVACFLAVPRTHEPAALLASVLSLPQFPESQRPRAARLAPELAGYGMAEHVMLSYGDESNRIDPWSLVTEEHARAAVATARETVALGRDVIDALFAC